MPSLRDIERASIRAFLEAVGNAGLFSGRVLDYGCGKQPYRDLIESFGADYTGYDRAEFAGSVVEEDVGADDPFYLPKQHQWDTVLCTQVLQYDREPGGLLSVMYEDAFSRGGHLVMTYPTHWPEVEKEDLWRFTKAGMERLLTDAGFKIVEHVPRHETRLPGGESLVHGYGVVAQA